VEFDALLRSRVFWLRDRLSGCPLSTHIQDIAAQMEDSDLRRRRTTERLRALLQHATETTRFYQRFRGASSLDLFPVVTKHALKENYAALFSDCYQRSALLKIATSGSYGTPLTFYLTPEKKLRQHAEIIYFGRWAGFDVGLRYALLSTAKAKPAWKRYLFNEVHLNPKRLDERWLSMARRELKRREVQILIGQSSAVAALAQYCIMSGDVPEAFAVTGVIAFGETVLESARQSVYQAFGVHLLSRYAAQELGVLAHENPQTGKLLLNTTSYVIEILDLKSDTPAAPGSLGRVVVTDLFSYAMPLIRYDTGDLAVLATECTALGAVPMLERLEGRQVESIFAVDGTRISPFAITGALRDLQQVFQYQFIQTSPTSYELRLVVQHPFAEAGIIRPRLLHLLGAAADLRLTYTDEIAPLPSGKRPSVLSYNQRTL